MHVLSYFLAAKVQQFSRMGFTVYIQYFVLCNIGVISTTKQGATDNIDHKKTECCHLATPCFYRVQSKYYSAFASSAGASATGASSALTSSTAGAASALGAALRERRVFFSALAVFSMFSSKSTSSMKAFSAASPWRKPSLIMRV